MDSEQISEWPLSMCREVPESLRAHHVVIVEACRSLLLLGYSLQALYTSSKKRYILFLTINYGSI